MIYKNISKMLFILSISTLFFACGSGGDGGGSAVDGENPPQSESIKCEVDTRYDERIEPYITNRDSVLMCGGTGWYKTWFPPVISWDNTTTGQNGTASFIDTQTRCFASIFCESISYWEARVPLAAGENNIFISGTAVKVLYDMNYNFAENLLNITQTIPGAEAINMPTDVFIKVIFSTAIDISTFNSQNFTLINSAGNVVPCTISGEIDNTIAILTPTAALNENELYTVRIGSGPKGPDSYLLHDYSFRFWTASSLL